MFVTVHFHHDQDFTKANMTISKKLTRNAKLTFLDNNVCECSFSPRSGFHQSKHDNIKKAYEKC